MFPSAPWKNISADAVDLIQRLLRVQIEERLTIDECIGHRWLKDAQTYWDLICLEKRLGHRYLTSEAEDLIWAPQLMSNSITFFINIISTFFLMDVINCPQMNV